jgi:uncharacterized repeat protein (TIGR01451 family)
MDTSWKLVVAAFAACICLPAAAQQQNPVQSKLEARKVVVAGDGKETFASADTAKPGDVIEYVATYRNSGKQPVKNLVATLPIPENTEFIAGSARPAGAKAGVSVAAFADIPLKRSSVRNGVAIEEPVPLREYRYLRWSASELGAEKAVTFAARVKVIDDTPTAAPKGGGR